MTATQDQQLHAVTSNNVVLESEVVPATVVYSPATGKIVSIIRKDEVISAAAATGATIDETEFYEEALRALGVDPENHRNLEDLVLMPGIVDSHVHLNEVSFFEKKKNCCLLEEKKKFLRGKPSTLAIDLKTYGNIC